MLRELLHIYCIFFKIGAVTFGGGYAMLPILQAELVQRRGWLSEQDILDYFAVGQSLPGIIAVNVATMCGSRRRGFAGAAAAVLGVVTPSILIIMAIAMFIRGFTEQAVVQKALRGINLAVAALLVSAVVKMGKTAVKGWLTLFIAIGSFAAVELFGMPVVPVLLVSVACVFLAVRLGGRSGHV